MHITGIEYQLTGLVLKHIPKEDIDGKTIKLGIGKIARQVLINIHETLADFEDSDKKDKEFLDILKDIDRMLDIEDGAVFSIGDIRITPVLVDHSAYDAYMFIIESEGKVIVHTGDFRIHGRLGKGLFDRIEKALIDKKVDVLITEGTMMSRLKETVLTEEQLQDKTIEVLSKPENKYAFLICSSTNVESLASFANAAMKLGRAFFSSSALMLLEFFCACSKNFFFASISSSFFALHSSSSSSGEEMLMFGLARLWGVSVKVV